MISVKHSDMSYASKKGFYDKLARFNDKSSEFSKNSILLKMNKDRAMD